MAELPQLVTEPGLSRPFYTGNARTEAYVTEALRALGDVSMDASTPSAAARFPLNVNDQDGGFSVMPSPLPDNESVVSLGRGELPGNGDGSSQYRGQYGYDASGPSLGERGDYDRSPATFQADEHGAFLPQPDASRFTSLSTRKPPPASSPNTPLRGDLPSSSQGIGGRFGTFPVKGKRHDSVGQMIAEPLVGSASFSDVDQKFSKGDVDDLAPKYEATEGTLAPPPGHPGPPPGAAAPAMPHASLYGGYDPGSYDAGPSFVPDSTVENEDDSQLPYMSPRERKVPFGSRPLPVPRPWLPLGPEAESIEEPHEPEDPPPAPVEDPDDERALNAAAAREVSRELDSLMYQPPTISKGLPPQPLAPETLNTPPAVHTSPRSSIESVTPASSPFARDRRRVSGSPPVPQSFLEPSTPTNGPPSPLGASASSSPMQQAQLPPPSIVHAGSLSPSLSSINSLSFRTPPELPPSPSPGNSQRSLPQPQGVSFSPGKSPPPRQGSGMISVAAFRRPAPRTSEPPVGSRDVSPLSVRKKELRGSPNTPRTSVSGTFSPMSPPPGAQPPVLAPSLAQEQQQEDEFDYISAYYSAGADDAASPPSYTESRARSGSLR